MNQCATPHPCGMLKCNRPRGGAKDCWPCYRMGRQHAAEERLCGFLLLSSFCLFGGNLFLEHLVEPTFRRLYFPSSNPFTCLGFIHFKNNSCPSIYSSIHPSIHQIQWVQEHRNAALMNESNTPLAGVKAAARLVGWFTSLVTMVVLGFIANRWPDRLSAVAAGMAGVCARFPFLIFLPFYRLPSSRFSSLLLSS